MKFQGKLAAARVLGELLAGYLMQSCPEKPDVILPIPLHNRRLRERGFNQAMELSREIAGNWNIPIARDLVIRKRATLPQTDLNQAARRRNVRKAFALNGSISNVEHVAIVDDVVTSGATVTEVARLLQQAGIPRITIWCCCRTSTTPA